MERKVAGPNGESGEADCITQPVRIQSSVTVCNIISQDQSTLSAGYNISVCVHVEEGLHVSEQVFKRISGYLLSLGDRSYYGHCEYY